MKFYIVTPTYNSLEWLTQSIRSVADQAEEGIEVHHHVQDGGSTDGTVDWLAIWQQQHTQTKGYTFTWESARDAGMYDAINKAWAKMPQDADVTAHLNSDEQYLPHALQGVAKGFTDSPNADILLSSYFVLDAQSRYICHRRPVHPYMWISQLVCEMATCATFHRAQTFRNHGLRFDTQWRIIGDMVLYRDIIQTNPHYAVIPNLITTSFTVTGNNLGWAKAVEEETARHLATLPPCVAKLHKLANTAANIKRRSCDLWHRAPQLYTIYLPGDTMRTERKIKHPTSHWGCREQGEQ